MAPIDVLFPVSSLQPPGAWDSGGQRCDVVHVSSELHVLEVGYNQGCDGVQYVEEVGGRSQEFMGHRAKGIGKIQKDDVNVPSLHLCRLDLVPDHAGMS